jgi:hypothetical protein
MKEGDMDAQIQMRRVGAKLLALRGRFDAAIASADEAVRLSETTDHIDLWGKALMDSATVLQLAGRRGESEGPLRAALELFEQKGNVVCARRVRAALDDL